MVDLVYNFIIFTLGLVIGSFLNVVIFRLDSEEKIVNDRSKCLHCGHILAWYDLAPILSFVFLKGKCRYCKRAISIQYPLIEMATGVLFVLIYNFSVQKIQILDWQFFIFVFYFLFIASVLIVIFAYDLKHYIIPDKVIYLAIIVSLMFDLFGDFVKNGNFYFSLISGGQGIFNFQFLMYNIQNSQFFNYLFAAFLAGGFFLAIVLLTRGNGMGGGDVKLGFLMGLILGWPAVLTAIFSSFIFGSIIGLYLIAVGKKKMKSMIPFGPFLVLGTFLSLFWGEEIVKWYFSIIIY